MRFSLLHIGLILLTSATGISAEPSSPIPLDSTLARRNALHVLTVRSPQSSQCAAGDAECGNSCIPSSYTCCPDNSGGCPDDYQCQLGDNGEYGCCPDGEICSGDGGVSEDPNLYDGAGMVKPMAGTFGVLMSVAVVMGLI